MALDVERLIIEATKSTRCWRLEVVQRLWSDYGRILRYGLEGGDRSSLIVKQISPPEEAAHPRGWNTDRSHLRKLRSYEVESAWYEDYSRRCGAGCRVPQCLSIEREDASGWAGRRQSVTPTELQASLSWLAHFHATFLGSSTEGLWECGTYWHLETRPDELKRLATEDVALSAAAAAIDSKLKASPFQTLVHGDAKLANFCFSSDGESVAAVDFQYVGGGCGIKDVAYFIGSCFGDEECQAQVPGLLDFYFERLRVTMVEREVAVDAEALEADWRSLYPFAWTDFHRFLKGWSPGHWKIHSYSERLAQEVLAQLSSK